MFYSDDGVLISGAKWPHAFIELIKHYANNQTDKQTNNYQYGQAFFCLHE